jgi:hypothetical protein
MYFLGLFLVKAFINFPAFAILIFQVILINHVVKTGNLIYFKKDMIHSHICLSFHFDCRKFQIAQFLIIHFSL